MRDAPPMKSIDVLAGEIHDQLSAQRRHLEGLDAKAGVLLGFAGILVVVAPETGVIWLLAARALGVVSATCSLCAFFPRDYPLVDLRTFRREYLSAEPSFTRLALLDTHLGMLDHTVTLTDRKARWLKSSVASLVVAILLGCAGLGLESDVGGR